MTEPYFQNELVTLYNGDCLELTEWLSADVLVTDPPYGIAHRQRKGGYYGTWNYQEIRHSVANDASTEIRDISLANWGNKPAMVFGSWKSPRPEGTNFRLIWHKQGQAPGPSNQAFITQDEEIYILGKGFIKTAPPMRSVIATQEARAVFVGQVGHPTPKPIGLMETLISRCPNGVIADPFAGSGATLLAARNLGRQAIGVELEEKYCELIANRLSQEAFDFGGL
jgi:site-specific DNA-methyltransferase (adenine-specific)